MFLLNNSLPAKKRSNWVVSFLQHALLGTKRVQVGGGVALSPDTDYFSVCYLVFWGLDL